MDSFYMSQDQNINSNDQSQLTQMIDSKYTLQFNQIFRVRGKEGVFRFHSYHDNKTIVRCYLLGIKESHWNIISVEIDDVIVI